MSLIKNSIYNIAGFAIPTIIAIPALGVLARQLGLENFGLFTLAFAVVGYASIFDGGLTRAVIREIAIFRDDLEKQKQIFSTASIVVLILGLIASCFLYFGATSLIKLLKVSDGNLIDAKVAFQLLAFIMPIYLLNQIWLAYLEGLEKFGNINIQRTISSSVLALLPLIFCLIDATLVNAIWGLVIGRIFSLLLTFFVCKKMIINSGLGFYEPVFKRLVAFGGWLTLSNIISPIMVYFDRFVISNIMGASKIAFYTAPAEGVARLGNIPFALARALFPKLSNSQDPVEKKRLEQQSYFLVSLVCLPIVILGILLSDFIMTIWMGAEYAGTSANVFKILLIGFLFNALAQIPYALLQSQGKAKTTALVHLSEVLPYLLLLFFLTFHYGVIGTAIAWSVRTFIDLIILFILSRKR
ncbi:putative O-antigen transporter [Acinetobacter proteolyticus]|uniref:Putative O-antigen transporter n=1 Tax=Acinetobacter proteolyticus TaxID=1776741 RepID=A0A653K7V1_9GAMM|nr:flippase [Acinetobacter proteolyticus]VXA57017.1 putative O-antigen transporter [Acinetobacter proteolyticus]